MSTLNRSLRIKQNLFTPETQVYTMKHYDKRSLSYSELVLTIKLRGKAQRVARPATV